MDVTLTEFGSKIGVSHAAVSQYETGKTVPGQAAFLMICELAQPGELLELMAARGESLPAEQALPKSPNVITRLLQASGMGRSVFSSEIGLPTSSLFRLENDSLRPSAAVIDKAKGLAVRIGRPDLALELSSSEWTVKAVFEPGEHFITTAGKKVSSEKEAKLTSMVGMLETVVNGGSSELVDLAEASLKIWVKQVQPVAAKKRVK